MPLAPAKGSPQVGARMLPTSLRRRLTPARIIAAVLHRINARAAFRIEEPRIIFVDVATLAKLEEIALQYLLPGRRKDFVVDPDRRPDCEPRRVHFAVVVRNVVRSREELLAVALVGNVRCTLLEKNVMKRECNEEGMNSTVMHWYRFSMSAAGQLFQNLPGTLAYLPSARLVFASVGQKPRAVCLLAFAFVCPLAIAHEREEEEGSDQRVLLPKEAMCPRLPKIDMCNVWIRPRCSPTILLALGGNSL